ncbi:ATP-NAD kinase-like domain-containing protein [Chytridium lagenaria]|nr:ATP-NAD kinase-like domain-containing protein [Chytridium lagenaria]
MVVSDSNRAAFIINPKAAHGTSMRIWEKIKGLVPERFPGGVNLLVTEYSGHAYVLARDAVITGGRKYDCLIGGDGTISQVVGGYISAKGLENGVTIGIIPSGTGGDFIRTFAAFAKDPIEALELILTGEKVIIDAGLATYTEEDPIQKGQQTSQRYFVNVASFGIGGNVVKAIEESTYSKITGSWAYWLHTAAENLKYRLKRIRLESWDGDDHRVVERNVYECAVGNGRFYGGSMMIAPHADPCDGKLDMGTLFDLTITQVVRHAEPGLKAGDFHTRLPNNVTMEKVSKLKAKAVNPSDRVYVELDGETSGMLPAEFEIVPSCVRLIIPATSWVVRTTCS